MKSQLIVSHLLALIIVTLLLLHLCNYCDFDADESIKSGQDLIHFVFLVVGNFPAILAS